VIAAIHPDPNTPGWVVLSVDLFLVLFLVFWTWRFRRFKKLLFSKNEFEEPTLHEINNKLEEINTEAPFGFAADRRANVYFRGEKISIIYGPVAWSDTSTHSNRCFFVIAPKEQSHAVQRNSDVFELAVSGTNASIFWVDMPSSCES
jgi:hypothetical protein